MSRGPTSAMLAIALTLTLAPATAVSQVRTSLDAGTGTARLGPASTASALLLGPRIRLHGLGADAWLEGNLARFSSGGWSSSLHGRAFWSTPVYDGLRARAGVQLDGGWYADGSSSGALLGLGRLDWSAGRYGAWLEAGAGRAGGAVDWGGVQVLEAGGRARVGDFRLLLSARRLAFEELFRTDPDTTQAGEGILAGVDPIPGSLGNRSRSYTDAELGVAWAPGALELEFLVGTRFSDRFGRREDWARASGALALTSYLKAVVTAGSVAGRPEQGLAGRDFYSVGFRLSLPDRAESLPEADPRPPNPVREVRPGVRAIRLVVPDADRVEIMGDFSDWRPLHMQRSGGDIWEIQRRIRPGIYRVNIRIDGGEWIVPPGLTAVRDEFSGRVGLLVVD